MHIETLSNSRATAAESRSFDQHLKNIGVQLRDWHVGTVAEPIVDEEVARHTRSTGLHAWSDEQLGLFVTDTVGESLLIEAEISEDMIAIGIPLGDGLRDFSLSGAGCPVTTDGPVIFALRKGTHFHVAAKRGMLSITLLVHIGGLVESLGSCEVYPELLRRIIGGDMSSIIPCTLPAEMRRSAAQILDFSAGSPLAPLFYKSKCAEMVWTVMQYLQRHETLVERGSTLSARELQAIEDVRHLLDHPGRSAWTTDKLARIVGMNRTKLRALFKQVCGTTLAEYHTAALMGEADRLLRETDLTISEIAFKLGYGDASSFSAAYKRVHGHSPGYFRTARQFTLGR
jgi:AraC-like DNA-binding protein